MPAAGEHLQQLLHPGDQAAWTTAALVTVRHADALLRGDADLWSGPSDEALLAQGRSSAQGPPLRRPFSLRP